VSAPPTAGELWAREQLALLLDARFAPRAVARFLLASQRRASAERRARPATARRMRRWVGAGAGAWGALALAGAEPFRRRVGAFVAWWALTWLMLDWHIGMFETEDGRPRNLGPADACTLVRVWLVPAAADAPAPWMCALAFVTDGLDGRLARASEPTRIGRDLEGLADWAFAAAALRGAVDRGWLSRAAGASELLRLATGLGYALLAWLGSASAPDARVLHAARVTTPVRAGGLVAAGLGHRQLADGLVIGGSAWSLVAVVRALFRSGS
jgi:phosphatidylglycerophosphate synthase